MSAAATLLLAAAPAIADVIVIRANGPSAARYAQGRTLPDATRMVLQRGDQIVLLDAHGTRTLSGPGTFTASGGTSGAAPSSLTQLASNATQRRSRVGAVRNLPGLSGEQVRPNIFLVDVAAPGKMCVVDPAGVSLWRAKTDAAGRSTITAADGKAASVDWIKGQSTQPWPAALPIAAGTGYSVTDAGAAQPTAIEFQLLADQPGDLQQLAKALIAHDCQGQVNVMVATTATSPAG